MPVEKGCLKRIVLKGYKAITIGGWALATLQNLIDWGIQLGSSSIISAIVATVVYYFLEGRKIKKELRITHLKEAIDQFYSPLLFHFDHMKAWSVFRGDRENYAFDPITLTGKLRDMESIMRIGIRLASRDVRNLWHEWQPNAIAAVELRKEGATYDEYDPQKFVRCSQMLHQALKDDYSMLEKKYFGEIGGKPLGSC